MAEKKSVATDANANTNADANADAVNTQVGEATNTDTTADADAVNNADEATKAENAPVADATTEVTAEIAEATTEKAPKDTSEMVVYAVDSTAVRIGDEYFYSSDWMITIPARLVEEAEKMGFVRVENA